MFFRNWFHPNNLSCWRLHLVPQLKNVLNISNFFVIVVIDAIDVNLEV